MTTKLGDLLLDEETALAFRAFLDSLVQKQRTIRAQIKTEREQEELNERRYEKLAAIAREWAEKQGVVPWMGVQHQAQAAFDTWAEEAGYLDIDEHFQLDLDWRDSWVAVYAARVDELVRSPAGGRS